MVVFVGEDNDAPGAWCLESNQCVHTCILASFPGFPLRTSGERIFPPFYARPTESGTNVCTQLVHHV